MKKIFFLLILCSCLISEAYAQELITFKYNFRENKSGNKVLRVLNFWEGKLKSGEVELKNAVFSMTPLLPSGSAVGRVYTLQAECDDIRCIVTLPNYQNAADSSAESAILTVDFEGNRVFGVISMKPKAEFVASDDSERQSSEITLVSNVPLNINEGQTLQVEQSQRVITPNRPAPFPDPGPAAANAVVATVNNCEQTDSDGKCTQSGPNVTRVSQAAEKDK